MPDWKSRTLPDVFKSSHVAFNPQFRTFSPPNPYSSNSGSFKLILLPLSILTRYCLLIIHRLKCPWFCKKPFVQAVTAMPSQCCLPSLHQETEHRCRRAADAGSTPQKSDFGGVKALNTGASNFHALGPILAASSALRPLKHVCAGKSRFPMKSRPREPSPTPGPKTVTWRYTRPIVRDGL